METSELPKRERVIALSMFVPGMGSFNKEVASFDELFGCLQKHAVKYAYISAYVECELVMTAICKETEGDWEVRVRSRNLPVD